MEESPDSGTSNHHTSLPDDNIVSYTEAGVSTAIVELEKGHENRLAVLYCALISRDAASADMAANAIHTYMESLNVPRLISLSRQFRESTSMEWSID